MAKQTKKAKVLAQIDRDALYSFDAALKALREHASKKFDEATEVPINPGVEPRHAND